ncbi:MAG TPA: potassium-transporting ATPase subunit KdpC [Clostridia bacterium]|nr:potassium-transporting ATPase subunit KdpC [Clostridia bacterium]
MKKLLITAALYTAVTTVLLGLVYPLVMTGIAQVLFHDKANGQIVYQGGKAAGSRLIGQPFTGDAYFHSRPSAAGEGYDAANSGASNLAPTSGKLVTIVEERTEAEKVGKQPVPIELVTASASGLDPHISPAAALYQVPRVARARGITETELRPFIDRFTEGRQLGLFGEPRVNVLALNLELDRVHPKTR